jgi:uncharacterized protein YjaG (DUF416 family)
MVIGCKSFLNGKREKDQLNQHFVTVIVPDKKIPFDEGTKKIEELIKQVKK